jgi:hypothetical protein
MVFTQAKLALQIKIKWPTSHFFVRDLFYDQNPPILIKLLMSNSIAADGKSNLNDNINR